MSNIVDLRLLRLNQAIDKAVTEGMYYKEVPFGNYTEFRTCLIEIKRL